MTGDEGDLRDDRFPESSLTEAELRRDVSAHRHPAGQVYDTHHLGDTIMM